MALKKTFESDVDVFLKQFDEQHPDKSTSQQCEINKYQRIKQLRDQAERPEVDESLWDGF